MPELVAALFSALPVPATGQDVPAWVHLVPAGTFRGVDGRGPYTLADPDAVIKASMAAGKLAVDENHATDLAAPQGRPAPARGWITALEARSDGLWGRVEWTASGKALLGDHAYRGISPAFVADRKSGRIVRVLRASLTNDPNLDLTTLHQRSDATMDLMKLREALGLAADADEAAILAATTQSRATGASLAATHAADLARIAQAAGLAGDAAAKPTADDLVTHLQARGAGETELAKTVIALQTKLDTMEAEQRKERATRAIDAAIAAGKPIRAMREHYITRHMADPAGVDKELAGLPSLHDGGARRPANDGAGAGKDPVELAAAASAYQRKLAEAGQEIDFATAVHAVQEGKQ